MQKQWDDEFADGKENCSSSALPFFPSRAEVEQEAFENYLFAKMDNADREYAEKLVTFRALLKVAPEPPGTLESPSLIQERTRALWKGLR